MAKALCKTIPADVRRQVEPQAYETPLLAWSAIKTSLLGTPFRRLAAAQQRLYSMAPTRLLTTFIVEWTRCFNEVGRLSGRPNRVITAAEVATMRAAICSRIPHTSHFLPMLHSCETLEQLRRNCEQYDTLQSSGLAPQPHVTTAAAAHAATTNAAGRSVQPRFCFACGSTEHILLKECRLFLAMAERMWKHPDEGFRAMSAAHNIVKRGAPAKSDLAVAEYSKPSKYIVQGRRRERAGALRLPQPPVQLEQTHATKNGEQRPLHHLAPSAALYLRPTPQQLPPQQRLPPQPPRCASECAC